MGKYKISMVSLHRVIVSGTRSHAVAWQHKGQTRTSDPDVCLFCLRNKEIKKMKQSEVKVESGGACCSGYLCFLVIVSMGACAEYLEEQV